ncbi:hypothetical protein [Pseudochrobactrum sp. XF203]|uniref:hypothetical protein n=1 Tax=Pseudochrobactrum sp. XF203 TaxID=2879116 RepID=UPI001CE2E043|nr:hypothetical protein [Pseudochrobactrum sp. XF203]UCA44767.1 hypothetical protein LDL70_10295 [Pseudochrobactrum sp. XF203]
MVAAAASSDQIFKERDVIIIDFCMDRNAYAVIVSLLVLSAHSVYDAGKTKMQDAAKKPHVLMAGL